MQTVQSLISGLPPKISVLISILFSNLFINRPHWMETKPTNYWANNVSCGGLPFDAWFVFVFGPPCSFVLPPVPVSACLASWPRLLPLAVVSSRLIYIILHPIWMRPSERRVETYTDAGHTQCRGSLRITGLFSFLTLCIRVWSP